MSQRIRKFIILIIGVLLFNSIFWEETLGVNVLIFEVYLIAAICLLFPESLQSRRVLYTMAATIITALSITLHGNGFAVFMYLLSFLLMGAFIHQPVLRSAFYATPSGVTNYLFMPFEFFSYAGKNLNASSKFNYSLRLLKILIIPVFIVLIFYYLFSNGNPVFGGFIQSFVNVTGSYISIWFDKLSFVRISFILLGSIVLSGLIYNSNRRFFADVEAGLEEYIYRKRKKRESKNKDKSSLNLGLKNEGKTALILMVMINLMLLMVNVIDIKWVWFGFNYTPEFDLKHFVHEGTYLLIVSILLSIGIMLYYFRENLNFHPKSKVLKSLAFVWIAQNVVLLISVGIRNYHYIHYFGLAYKRIGVILFLLLVLYGLYTLYQKIQYNRSGYYLFKVNSWSLFMVLLTASIVDWDATIARYNLSHPLKDNMETCFLLTMSDRVLPQIDQHKYILDQSVKLNTYINFAPLSYKEVYEKRVKTFLQKKQQVSWLSWTWEDYKAYEYFKGGTDKIAE